jgi:hypothetical protein
MHKQEESARMHKRSECVSTLDWIAAPSEARRALLPGKGDVGKSQAP